MMNNPVEVALSIDNLGMGTELVACGVDSNGLAFGVLLVHTLSPLGNRYWKATGGAGEDLTAVQLTHRFDDMVLTKIPEGVIS